MDDVMYFEADEEDVLYIEDGTDKSNRYKRELEDTAEEMSKVGVVDVTIDNTAENVPNVYKSGQDSQQPVIKNLQNQLTETEAAYSYMREMMEEREEELIEVRSEISKLGVDVDPGIEPISDAIPAVYKAGQDSQQSIISSLQNENRELNNEVEQISKRHIVYANELIETINKMQELGVMVEDDEIDGVEYSNVSEGVTGVYESGKKSFYDEFWDNFQQNGNRTNYEGAFYGAGWIIENFKPKYNISPIGVINSMFYYTIGLQNVDLAELFEQLGIILNTVSVTTIYHLFAYSRVSRIPELNLTSVTTFDNVFRQNTYLTTIDKIILKSDGSQTFSANCFQNNTNLQNIVFEGIIGNNLDMKWCPLSKKSITNIVNVLKADTSGKTLTLSKTAVNNAFTTSEWTSLSGTKTNWTISLV